MKIVKLNRSFNIHKYQGFEIGVKFDLWGTEARDFEYAVADRFGQQAWLWKHGSKTKVKEDWATTFGKRVKGETTPYWVYLRQESMLTLILLSIDQKDTL